MRLACAVGLAIVAGLAAGADPAIPGPAQPGAAAPAEGQDDQAWRNEPAPEWVVPGARITMHSVTATTLKKNDPLNPRIGVAGSGYQQYDILAVTPAGVLMEYRHYVIPLNETQPQLIETQLKMVDTGSGGDLWIPASEMANPQLTTAEDANPKVELGPYELEGETYDGIHVTKTEQNGEITVRRVYDQHTGIILYQSELLDNAEQRLHIYSEYRSYRTAQFPWQRSAFTEQVRGFSRLVYDFRVTKHVQGFPDQHRNSDLTYEIGQSTETLMHVGVTVTPHVPSGAPPMRDTPQEPVPQMLSTNQRLGPYIAPDVLGRLENGQVLDEDATVGYTIRVTDVYQVDGVTLVEITEQGPGNSYSVVNTYDASVGLLVAAVREVPGLDLTYESTLKSVE